MRPRSARETKYDRLARWDREVRTFLDKHYANAPHYKASLVDLWQKYADLGLPTAHFVSEFTSGKKSVIFQRAWEMMVARHLDALGYRITVPSKGPDFRAEREGTIIWVEAIAPEPMGIAKDDLEWPKPGEFKVRDVPHNEVLLRWTAAIKEKGNKLKKYRAKNIVGDKDAYVIAINGGQLGAFPLQHGISQFPYAVEAVYSAGPFTITIDSSTGKVVDASNSVRPAIKNAKGAPVSTSTFLSKEFEGVSAIIACSLDRSETAILQVDIVHNHFAGSPVEHGSLGKEGEEWITEPDGKGGINVRKKENVGASPLDNRSQTGQCALTPKAASPPRAAPAA